jgi:type IV secretory pathway VirB6-like protein
MSIKTSLRDTRRISKIATGIIFLALIRCISEPFRLQYYSTTTLAFGDIKPFLIGSLVAALALFAMTVLFYFGKYKIIIITCVLTIVILLIIKKIYLIR